MRSRRVSPDVERGRYAVKRIVGDMVVVEADAFTYGHDEIAVRLDHRRRGKQRWQSTWMQPSATTGGAASSPSTASASTDSASSPGATRSRPGRTASSPSSTPVSPSTSNARRARCWRRPRPSARAATTRKALLELGAPPARRRSTRPSRAELDDFVACARAMLDPDDGTSTYTDTSSIRVERPLAGLRARGTSSFPAPRLRIRARSGTLADVTDRIESIAAMGFDVVVPPADSSDRRRAPQGPEQHHAGEAR